MYIFYFVLHNNSVVNSILFINKKTWMYIFYSVLNNCLLTYKITNSYCMISANYDTFLEVFSAANNLIKSVIVKRVIKIFLLIRMFYIFLIFLCCFRWVTHVILTGVWVINNKVRQFDIFNISEMASANFILRDFQGA